MIRYRIQIVSDSTSWINAYIPALQEKWRTLGHQVSAIHDFKRMKTGDFAFYLGCGRIVPPTRLSLYRNNLVVHESALPLGKGWSPLSWQILQGKNNVPITLFEAAERVDSGLIYAQDVMRFQGTELIDDLRAIQAKKSVALCLRFVREYPAIVKKAKSQKGRSSYFKRRTPADSRLNIDKSIRQQFNLLRIVDNERYPAHFRYRGHNYSLKIYGIHGGH